MRIAAPAEGPVCCFLALPPGNQKEPRALTPHRGSGPLAAPEKGLDDFCWKVAESSLKEGTM